MHIIIISIIVAMYVLDLVLNLLNVNYSKNEMPENVRNIYDETEYQKWINYEREHLRFGIIRKISVYSFNSSTINF